MSVKTVTVGTIKPISYAVVGVGIVLIVVAGVIASRRKKVWSPQVEGPLCY